MTEQERLFWVNDSTGVRMTYSDLLGRLSALERGDRYVQEQRPVDAFVGLLAGLLEGEDVVLLDDRFDSDELVHRTDRSETFRVTAAPKSWEDLHSILDDADPSWQLGLYTSGTTGDPTRIDQTLAQLTRNVKRDGRFDDDVWAFAYEPTHIAGLLVFFQAFYNRNTMVYVFDDGLDDIARAIEREGITHISATPTFYRLSLARLDRSFDTVASLTSGGEPFDAATMDRLRDTFPNATIKNIYALTEAGSLFESEGETFEIPSAYDDAVTIAADGELLLHERLLGDTSGCTLDGDWYHTGDIVEEVDDGTIRFVGRQGDTVTVAGYQVNPRNVETVLTSLDGVVDAVVYPRKTTVTGTVLVADILPEESVDTDSLRDRLRTDLDERLESWQVPRKFSFVDEIPKTRSGKKIRE